VATAAKREAATGCAKTGNIQGNSEKPIYRHAREGRSPGAAQILDYFPSGQRERRSAIKLLLHLRSNDVFSEHPEDQAL
jgi:hypothetical protein